MGSAGTGQLLVPRVTLHLLTLLTAIDKNFNVYLKTTFSFSMFCIYSRIKVLCVLALVCVGGVYIIIQTAALKDKGTACPLYLQGLDWSHYLGISLTKTGYCTIFSHTEWQYLRLT